MDEAQKAHNGAPQVLQGPMPGPAAVMAAEPA
jgi:hypothetical protein